MTMPHDRHRRSSVPPRIHVVDADMPVTFQRARELADVPRFRVHEDISVWRKRPGQSCAGLCTEGFPDLGGDGSLASCLILDSTAAMLPDVRPCVYCARQT